MNARTMHKKIVLFIYYQLLAKLIKNPRSSKKQVFGSSVGYRGGKLPNSCLPVGSPNTCIEIIALTCYR
jgi:hypothetical protein